MLTLKDIKIVPLAVGMILVILIVVMLIQWHLLGSSQKAGASSEIAEKAKLPAVLPELPQNNLYLKNAPVYSAKEIAPDEHPAENADDPKTEENPRPAL